MALPVLLYQRTGSPALTGLLVTLEAVPYLLLGLPVGALVESWDRRRTMVRCALLNGLVVATVPVAAALGVLTTGHLLLVGLATATLFVFDDAAGFGALPELVGRDGLGPAYATLSSVSTVIGLVGPAVGGVLATTLGAAEVLAVDAVSYALSALLLTRTRWDQRPRQSDPPRLRAQVREGLVFLWGHPVVRLLTLMGTGLSLSVGAVYGLLVAHAVTRLGLADDDGRLGLLYAALSLGALATSLALTRLQRRFRTGVLTLVGGSASGLLLLVWAVSTSPVAGLVVLVLWQAGTTLVILNGIVVRQRVTPDHLQSRVNTTARMIAWGGNPLGAAVAGVLAEGLGTPVALGLAGLGVLVALVGGLRAGAWRIGRLDELAVDNVCQ